LLILDALGRVLPVLLLFALGAVLRRTGFLAETTIADLRRLVLTVTLPSALFLTFLRVSLEARYLPIVAIVFAACVLMLVVGPFLVRGAGVRSWYGGPLLTGFEAGMLGYAIYGGVFGQEALYRFGIVDLGQVLFVFFVLATVLTRHATGRTPDAWATVLAFLRTPVILAIAAGVAGSLLGLGPVLDSSPLSAAVLQTLALLGAVTTPVIAIVIGYGTRLRPGALSWPARTVAVRMTAWVLLAIAFDKVVVEGLLGLDRLFGAAVLVMAVLPPPFVIPLYMRDRSGETDADAADADDRERGYVTDTLSLATLATLVAIPLIAVAFAG
jgi:hypothetical protein